MTTPAQTPKPLPRSLLPLPDESLTGYLLRLSHRLDESPLRLAGRTGLIAQLDYSRYSGPVRQPSMIELPEDLAHAFAAAVRLTPATVGDLTLMPFQQTYPPVAGEIHRRRSKPRAGPLTAWISLRSTKFCPHCLAGDGSTIQQRHGGPWKRQWHLPVVFACLEHDTFLHDTCPHCRRPIHSGRYTNPYLQMVPAAAAAGLHPAQCRTRTGSDQYCQGRLDQHAAFHHQQLPPLTPQTAALQRRLLDLIHPDATGPENFQHFADLLVLTTLVTQARPRRPDLPAPPELTPALDAHVERQESQITTRPAREGFSSKSLSWAAEPQDAPATAAILTIAEHCRDSSNRTLRDTLGSLLEHSADRRHPRWGQVWKQLEHCSEDFRNELDHALASRFPPTTPWQDRRGTLIPPQPPDGYTADHVPQEVPLTWFQQYFSDTEPHTPVARFAMRRTAALQLVQAAANSSPREAAEFLGVPERWLTNGARLMSPEAMARTTSTFEVTQALHNLAQHLADIPDQVNYRERRQRFATWHLPREQWEALLAATPIDSESRGLQPLLTRNVTSAYIWAQITGSEWTLAPIMRTSGEVTPWAQRSGPTSQGMRCLTNRWIPQAALLADAADALAQDLAVSEQAQ